MDSKQLYNTPHPTPSYWKIQFIKTHKEPYIDQMSISLTLEDLELNRGLKAKAIELNKETLYKDFTLLATGPN